MISVSLPPAILAPAHRYHVYRFPKQTVHVSHPRYSTHCHPSDCTSNVEYRNIRLKSFAHCLVRAPSVCVC